MKREEQIMNDSNLSAYTDKQRGWINESFMDGVRWADDNRPVDWQQVRIQAAIAAMQGLCNSCHDNCIREIMESTNERRTLTISHLSIVLADTLVKELKGE